MEEKTAEQKELERIISIIKDGRANEVSPSEILLSIKDLIPPKVIIQSPEPKSSPERLEYFKRWRETQKELKELKLKEGKKELAKQKKIAQSLKRTGYYCYGCKSSIKVNPENNKHSIESKRNDKRTKILITNECPSCGLKVKAFGGYL